jgi:hypothetical protein
VCNPVVIVLFDLFRGRFVLPFLSFSILFCLFFLVLRFDILDVHWLMLGLFGMLGLY